MPEALPETSVTDRISILRDELKAWEKSFKETHGRKPTKEETKGYKDIGQFPARAAPAIARR